MRRRFLADFQNFLVTEFLFGEAGGQIRHAGKTGDVQIERKNFDEAGKAFMGVALLYDDPAITPRALQKAAIAYQKAGKKEEADRVAKQLHEKYPDFAGG